MEKQSHEFLCHVYFHVHAFIPNFSIQHYVIFRKIFEITFINFAYFVLLY